LLPHGYHLCPFNPGLWQHDTWDICFTLVIDDFTIHYTNWDDADHLLAALCIHYQVTEDWEAAWYCGLTLQWDYHQCTVDISMPRYIEHALMWFCHPSPCGPNMHYILANDPPMAPKSNTPQSLTTQLHMMLLTTNTFKRSLVPSSTMHVPLI